MIEHYIIGFLVLLIIVLIGLIIAYYDKYGYLTKTAEQVKDEGKKVQEATAAKTQEELSKPIRIVYFTNIFMPLLIIVIAFAFYLLFFLPHIHIISSASFKRAVSSRIRSTLP